MGEGKDYEGKYQHERESIDTRTTKLGMCWFVFAVSLVLVHFLYVSLTRLFLDKHLSIE